MYFKWLMLLTTEYKLDLLFLPHTFIHFYGEAVHQNGGRKLVLHLRYADLIMTSLKTLYWHGSWH